MDQQKLLQKMCNYYLTNIDIRAIAKNRGFSATETKNRQVFQNYFVSDIGMTQVMASLTQKEHIFLHYLSYLNKEQDISVFERLYSVNNPSDFFQSSTQKYKTTIKQIQKKSDTKRCVAIYRKANHKICKNGSIEICLSRRICPFFISNCF